MPKQNGNIILVKKRKLSLPSFKKNEAMWYLYGISEALCLLLRCTSTAHPRTAWHYRSKTHFSTNKYIFQQKYVHLGIRNTLVLIKKLFEKDKKISEIFWNQQDPNPRTSRSKNLLSKIKSKMLGNGALWASSNQNGALHSRHEKPPLWHCFQ